MNHPSKSRVIESLRMSKNSLSSTMSSAKKEKFKVTTPTLQKKNQTTKTKRGSENQEFCYEEMEKSSKSPVNQVRSRAKQSISQSKSPLKEVQRANKSKTPSTSVSRNEKTKRREKSINADLSQGDSQFFPESSKKLQVLDNEIESGHKFK